MTTYHILFGGHRWHVVAVDDTTDVSHCWFGAMDLTTRGEAEYERRKLEDREEKPAQEGLVQRAQALAARKKGAHQAPVDWNESAERHHRGSEGEESWPL